MMKLVSPLCNYLFCFMFLSSLALKPKTWSITDTKDSQWRFQPECLPFTISLFKASAFWHSRWSLAWCSPPWIHIISQHAGHISNSLRKCPLQGFNTRGRQISWKMHYKPLPIHKPGFSFEHPWLILCNTTMHLIPLKEGYPKVSIFTMCNQQILIC